MDEREAILGDMWTELIRPNGDLERVRRLPEAARLLEAGAHDHSAARGSGLCPTVGLRPRCGSQGGGDAS